MPALADAVRTGRVLPSRLRGRAGMPTAAQAAGFFLRERLGETSVQGVRVVVATTSAPSGLTAVEVVVGSAHWCVHVTSRPGHRSG